eukprot:m.149788 g.149788  ORF g.149788 m.149788 type:complete len:537 (-) comp30682_c0_seq2:1912-3522(-)
MKREIRNQFITMVQRWCGNSNAVLLVFVGLGLTLLCSIITMPSLVVTNPNMSGKTRMSECSQFLVSLGDSQTAASTRSVNLAQCGLSSLPDELSAVTDMEVLKLEKNLLSTLPTWISEKLPRLHTLFLTGNHIDQVPTGIAKLTSLRMLSLRDCGLRDVQPGSFPDSLVWLILTNNRLTSIPQSFGQLTRLRKLMLSGNQLESLPSSFEQLHDLELIRLAGNRLKSFPSCFRSLQLQRLSWVAVGDNPLITNFAAPILAAPKVAEPTVMCISSDDLKCDNLIGSGSSGKAFRCSLLNTNERDHERPVVLKQYRAGRGSDGSSTTEMKMMVIAAMLQHPNIVPVVGIYRQHCCSDVEKSDTGSGCRSISLSDIRSDDGVVMPYLQGLAPLGQPPTFETITRDTAPYSVSHIADVCSVVLKVGSAVEALHSAGIFHGDLYAHNVLVNVSTHSVFVGDFGAAFHVSANNEDDLAALRIIETRAFCALVDDLVTSLSSASTSVEVEQSSKKRLWALARVCNSSKSLQTILNDTEAACGLA